MVTLYAVVHYFSLEFWTSVIEMCKIAEPLNFSDMLSNYLRSLIELDTCLQDDCIICLNAAVLALYAHWMIPQIYVSAFFFVEVI